jgi:hypothetical protein
MISSSQRPIPTQNMTKTTLVGFRTRDPSNQAVSHLCFRPHGYQDRLPDVWFLFTAVTIKCVLDWNAPLILFHVKLFSFSDLHFSSLRFMPSVTLVPGFSSSRRCRCTNMQSYYGESKADSHIPCRSHAVPLPFQSPIHTDAATMPRPCHDPATTLPLPCHYPATTLPLPCHSPRGSSTKLNAALSRRPMLLFDSHNTIPFPRCSHAVTLPRPCHEPVVKRIFVAWQGNGMGKAWYV